MNPERKAVLGWLVTSALIGGLSAAEPDSRTPAQRLADANNAFGLGLHAQLRKQPGNLFYSPFSIATCLHMLMSGARGDTREQLSRTLHLGGDQEAIDEFYGRLVSALSSATHEVTFEMANGLWLQKREAMAVDGAFLRSLRRNYAAELETVDFRNTPVLAAATVNRWASERTHGRIASIVDPGQFQPLDTLFLASAAYLKADWQWRFSESATVAAAFRVTKERSVPIKLMTQTGIFPLFEAPDFQVLELPYVGREFRMLVFLPRAVDGLPRLEASLNDRMVARCLAGLEDTDAAVALPRFTLDSRHNLAPVLRAMGVLDAFIDRRADFSGVDGTRTLFIGRADHLAWIEVHEQGTEAAAVTHAMMTRGLPHHVPFRADHPFLFLIFHRRTGLMIFLGRLVEPNAG